MFRTAPPLRCLLFVLASLLPQAGASLERPANAPPWEKEPTAVLGVTLGAPLEESGIKRCPDSAPCYEGSATGPLVPIVVLLKLPDLGLVHEVKGTIALHEGKVANLGIFVRHADFARMRDVLIERYGEPTARRQGEVGDAMGARFPKATLTWFGRHVILQFTERAGNLDHSHVLFVHVPTAQQRDAARKGATKDAASKL